MLCLRPRRLRFPASQFIAALRDSLVSFSITVFERPDLQSCQVLARSVANRRGPISACAPRRLVGRPQQFQVEDNLNCLHMWNLLRIPMMSISQSDLMPIRSERSDAGLSQCEIVIGISQDFCLFSLS